MTTPVEDRDDRREILVGTLTQYRDVCDDDGEVIGCRQDVLAILKFMDKDTPSVHDAIYLFWNMYQPRLAPLSDAEDRSEQVPNLSARDIYLSEEDILGKMYPPAPAPSEQLDELLLRCLDWVYERFRVPYEIDAADNAERQLGLVIELHIVAARAFKLRQVEGNQISEEWESRLRSVEATVRLIKTIASSYGSPYWYPSFALSADAIWGMTQLELSRVSKTDGSYADAIDYLTQSAYSYVEAFEHKGTGIEAAEVLLGIDILGNAGPDDRHGGSPWTSSLNWNEETIKNDEMLARENIDSRFTPLQVSLEEVASLFNLLKQSKATDDVNWREIAEDCEGLAVLPFMDRDVFTGVKDFVENEEGNLSLSWSEFWYGAGAWATAQLSPSELVKTLELERASAAETRLKNYFFESGWASLSERAQERLISADRDWNSRERVSKEAILRHLLRATEQMCFDFIWRPLEESVARGNNLPEFTNRMSGLAKRRRAPSVHDYSWACQSVFCQQNLAHETLSSSEIEFIQNQLPKAMRRLNHLSGSADHEPEGYEIERAFSHDDLRSLFREFLGIGRPGILPQLARIGRKLQSHRR